MHDVNGKKLNVGDEVYSGMHGLSVVKSIAETNRGDYMRGGNSKGGEFGYDQNRVNEEKLIKVRSWKEMAELALMADTAVNLSGIVHGFSEIITEVRIRLDAEGKGGTDAVKKHPVCVLFANAILSLAWGSYFEAQEWAKEQIKAQ